MTERTAPSAAAAEPTAEEIEAAVRILMRAWVPGFLLPGGPPKTDTADDEDDFDPDEYCGCAGTDDDGESLGCNCGGGCVCDDCSYSDYARYNRCFVQGCGKKPAFRVVRFGLVDQYVQEPTARGAVCPHAEGEDHFCTPDTVYVAAGPQLQIFDYQPGCSIAHAVQLRDAHQGQNRDGRDQYSIESWNYVPHDRELPGPLPELREHTRSARDSTRFAITRYAKTGDPGYWLRAARREIARAAWHAGRELERPGQDDDFDDEPTGPVQEEPDWPDAPE